MTWQTSKRVWDNVPDTIIQSDRLMLLALAEFADEHGICWPSYATLAKMVGVNERSAIRIVEKLEESGHIFIVKQQGQSGGRGYTNVYFVTLGLSQRDIETTKSIHPMLKKGVIHNTLNPEKRVLPVTKKGVTGDNKGVIHNTRTIMNPSIEPPIRERKNQRPPTVPAVQVFVEVTEKYCLNKTQIKVLSNKIGDTPAALDKWREAVTAWQLCGYKLTNINGMLDWFTNGIPTYKNGATQNGHKPNYSNGRTGHELESEPTVNIYDEPTT